MTRVIVSRKIEAPIERVFRAVTDIERLSDSNPDVVGVKFLSDSRSGAGTRFIETRKTGKKTMDTELEIVEWTDNHTARMVADSHGTVWDTLFTVEPAAGQTKLTIAMDARPHKLLPKLMNPIMKGFFRKGMEKHIDAVRAYCEQR